MTNDDRDVATAQWWDFRLHWLMLLRPCVMLLIGLALYKFGRDFAQSRTAAFEIDELLRSLEPTLGRGGLRALRDWAAPASLLAVLLVFGSPLAWALLVRATTILRVDGRQILWQRGVFARRITQVEIGEIVGVNVDESVLGRIFGYGTVDVETRGEDRLFARFIENARGFAGLVLDSKRRARGP